MTPKVAISGARWEAIEVLLDRSLELEPASQDALIEATRSTDPVLAGELARLVDAGRHLGGFLEQPAALYAAPLLAWAAERAPLQPGTTLGPYEIVRRLGRGATATVYLSRDPKHDREVAVKVLHPEIAESVGPERFLHEIQLAATLHHPHILPLFDSGRMAGSEGAGDLLYYVMPHVEGESLRGHLSEGRLPRDEAVRIAREVAGALDYSHRRGVIHRDIKPENILLQDGQAIVADFGIARALDASGADRSDTGGTGTPAYMSPEQRRPGAPVDGRTDVYSLGCVLYEMLTGEPPFAGSSIDEIVRRQAAGPPASLLARGLNVPSSLDRAVTRALAALPDARFATAGAFAEALESAGHETPGRPRSRAWIGMAGAGAIAAGVAGTWLWPHGPQVVPAAERIAVLPFEPPTGDTGLAHLGEDLAGTVSLTLEGVGQIGTVDRLALLTRAARIRQPRTVETALALGRQFGAGSVLQGTLRRQGGRVRVEATLLRSDRPVPVARATVVAPAESLSVLTDSLVWALLRQVWLGRAAPTPSLSGVTTRSIAALRAFLEGERAMVTNRWTDAADAYRVAFGADSEFALAYSRYSEASVWAHTDAIEPEVRRRLAAERLRLPERDRLLADERLSDTSAATRLRLLGELTRRYPNYWPGWFFYGDAIVHFGLLNGHPWSEGRAAFRRALAESPDLLPAWEHLGWISTGQDTAAFRQSVEQRVRLGYYGRPGGPATSRGDRLLDAVGRGDGAITPALRPLADSVAHSIVADRNLNALQTEVGFGFPAAQVAIDRTVLAAHVSPELESATLRSLALSWAARGAWDSALASVDRYVARGVNPRARIDAYSLATLGAWLEAISPAQASLRRAAAFAALSGVSDEDRPTLRACLYWLDGVLAFRRGDRETLAAVRDTLEALHTPDADGNARNLSAFARALDGHRAEAGRQLAALEWASADRSIGQLERYDLLVSRLSAATWLAESGDREQAVRLLRAADAKGGGKSAEWYVTSGWAHLALAHSLEALGNFTEARDEYRQFLRRLDLPGPSQRPAVDDAKAALARLNSSEES